MSVRVESADSGTAGFRPERGGANPTSTLFRKADWWVDDVSLSMTQRLIQLWHYSGGGSNTATFTHGLFPCGWFWESQCMGVAWWLPPTRCAAKSFCKENPGGVLALSRLAVHESVPTNGESFLIRHSMQLIDRCRWPTLVSYADNWRGHTGAIYKAAGFEEISESKPQPRYVKDGRLISRKIGQKTRTHAEMLALGAEYVGHWTMRRFVHRVPGERSPNDADNE